MTTLFPLPPQHHVKWERLIAFHDDRGKCYVKYSIRYTTEPLPEWCSPDQVQDHTRSFVSVAKRPDGSISSNHEDTGEFTEIFSAPYMSRAWTAPSERLLDLINAVRSGDVPQKKEGARAEMFCGDEPVYFPEPAVNG